MNSLSVKKPRKIHSHEAGYIAERKNPCDEGKVVIYIASEQFIDAFGCKYAIVCDAHSIICGETSIPKARIRMKCPDSFCPHCAGEPYS